MAEKRPGTAFRDLSQKVIDSNWFVSTAKGLPDNQGIGRPAGQMGERTGNTINNQ